MTSNDQAIAAAQWMNDHPKEAYGFHYSWDETRREWNSYDLPHGDGGAVRDCEGWWSDQELIDKATKLGFDYGI